MGTVVASAGAAKGCWGHCVGLGEVEGRRGYCVGTAPSICEKGTGEREGSEEAGWPVERYSGARDECTEEEKDEGQESCPGRVAPTEWAGFKEGNWSGGKKAKDVQLNQQTNKMSCITQTIYLKI